MAAMMQDEECSKEPDEMISDLDAFHINDDGLTAHDDVSTDDDSGLPHVLIITHVPDAVFDSDEARVSCILYYIFGGHGESVVVKQLWTDSVLLRFEN
jgi:hypothetical protein